LLSGRLLKRRWKIKAKTTATFTPVRQEFRRVTSPIEAEELLWP